jgi:hypothetical protein
LPVRIHPPRDQRAGDSPPESLDRPLNPTYVRVVVVEAAIIVLLWLFGRMFS